MDAIYERLEKLSGGSSYSYAGLHLKMLEFEKKAARERYTQAIPIIEELIEKAEQTAFTEFTALLYARYAQALLLNSLQEEASDMLDLAEELSAPYPNNFALQFHNRNTRAYLFAHQNDFASAYELFFSLIEDLEHQYQKTQSVLMRIRLAHIYGSLALQMARLEIVDEAVINLNKALEISRELNDHSQVIRHLNNLNVAYEQLGDQNAALEVLIEAKEMSEQIGDYSSLIRIDYNLGIAYLQLVEFERAKQYFTDGLEHSNELNLRPGVMHHSFGLSEVNREQGFFSEARAFAIQAEELAHELGSKPILADSYRSRYQTEKAAGDFETALRYHELFKEMDDEYKDVVRSQAVEELMIQHRVETTRAENEFLADQLILEERASRQKNMFIIILALLFIITVGFAYYFFKVKGQLQAANSVLDIQKNRIASKNTKLEPLSQQRNAFIHVIIHDLRNPLSTIDGASQILQMNEKSDTPEEIRELTDIIVSASKRMNLLISSLLNIFETDGGNIESEFVTTNSKHTIQKVINEYRPLAAKKQITLKSELVDSSIITHPESVIGILSNLISNAIKYSPDNTEITVLSKVTDNEWELVVRDQGPGFSEQDFEDIFKPFAKLSASPTGDETSTGVGLYSAKTSIDRLNGQIDINRAYEDGAEFICRIPVELADEQLETV